MSIGDYWLLRVQEAGVYLFHITSNREHKTGPYYRMLLASDNRNIISSNGEGQLRVDVLWLNSIIKTQLASTSLLCRLQN